MNPLAKCRQAADPEQLQQGEQAADSKQGEMNRPVYFKDKIPSYWRRNKYHDYRRRCIYMVTVRKAEGMPALSEISSPGSNAIRVGVRLSALGGIINNEIYNLRCAFPSVRTFDYVIMPDHVHFIVYLTENGKCHLGDVVKHLKGAVSVAWHRFQGRGNDVPVEPVFMEGYHDRESFSYSQSFYRGGYL